LLEVIQTKIETELQKLDKLFQESEPLLALCRLREPDFIEMSAAALCLHSFYNGVENIISIIVKNIDKNYDSSNGYWHKTLFEKAFTDTDSRSKIFRADLQEPLGYYLAFRHVIRHSYDYEISWERLKPLINNVEQIWQKIKEDIQNFIAIN
jgi:hypothetical protein